MGTSASIIVEQNDGSFLVRHQGYDGYIEEGVPGLGLFLLEKLNTREKIDFVFAQNHHFMHIHYPLDAGDTLVSKNELITPYPKNFGIPEVIKSSLPRDKANAKSLSWESLYKNEDIGWADFEYLFKDSQWHLLLSTQKTWESSFFAPLSDIVPALKLRHLPYALDDLDDVSGFTPEGDLSEVWTALDDYITQQDLFDGFSAFHGLAPEGQEYIIYEMLRDYEEEDVKQLMTLVDPIARHKRLEENTTRGLGEKLGRGNLKI